MDFAIFKVILLWATIREFTIFWETIWIERLYIPIHFGRFDSEISNLKKIHTSIYYIEDHIFLLYVQCGKPNHDNFKGATRSHILTIERHPRPGTLASLLQPLKNPIDCPRSGSITIADFGWISYNKKLQTQLFHTLRHTTWNSNILTSVFFHIF